MKLVNGSAALQEVAMNYVSYVIGNSTSKCDIYVKIMYLHLMTVLLTCLIHLKLTDRKNL